MSRKRWTLFLLIFFVALSPAFAGNRPLNIICDRWPPYQTVINNQVEGFSTAIVKMVFQRMQVGIDKIHAYPWRRAIAMIEAGKVDALYSANFTRERAGFARYPDEPLVTTPWVMWVREGSGLRFRSMDDLEGKRIGLVNGYSYTRELWDYVNKHRNVEIVPNDELNFKKLHAGRVDYIVADLRNGAYIVKHFGFDNLVPLMEQPIKFVGLYIIFNKKTVPQSFVVRFSEELKALKKEAVFVEMHEKYFGEKPLDFPQEMVRPVPERRQEKDF